MNIKQGRSVIALFEESHALIYKKLAFNFAGSLAENDKRPREDNEVGDAEYRGYLRGRNEGVAAFPTDISDFSIQEVLELDREE